MFKVSEMLARRRQDRVIAEVTKHLKKDSVCIFDYTTFPKLTIADCELIGLHFKGTFFAARIDMRYNSWMMAVAINAQILYTTIEVYLNELHIALGSESLPEDFVPLEALRETIEKEYGVRVQQHVA